MKCVALLESFDSFVTEEKWNEQFEVKLDTFLD